MLLERFVLPVLLAKLGADVGDTEVAEETEGAEGIAGVEKMIRTKKD